jgi:hypothetical protein
VMTASRRAMTSSGDAMTSRRRRMIPRGRLMTLSGNGMTARRSLEARRGRELTAASRLGGRRRTVRRGSRRRSKRGGRLTARDVCAGGHAQPSGTLGRRVVCAGHADTFREPQVKARERPYRQCRLEVVVEVAVEHQSWRTPSRASRQADVLAGRPSRAGRRLEGGSS